MARLADYFLVVTYDLDKRGGLLSVSLVLNSFNGVSKLRVNRRRGGRRGSAGPDNHHRAPLDAVMPAPGC